MGLKQDAMNIINSKLIALFPSLHLDCEVCGVHHREVSLFRFSVKPLNSGHLCRGCSCFRGLWTVHYTEVPSLLPFLSSLPPPLPPSSSPPLLLSLPPFTPLPPSLLKIYILLWSDLLGGRLERELEGKYRNNASLCYICSGNVEKFVESL